MDLYVGKVSSLALGICDAQSLVTGSSFCKCDVLFTTGGMCIWKLYENELLYYNEFIHDESVSI
jgi:hypothetical protein